MKRAATDCDTIPPSKRRNWRASDSHKPRFLELERQRTVCPNAFGLTPETLRPLQSPLSTAERASSIQRWASSCDSDSDPNMDPRPPLDFRALDTRRLRKQTKRRTPSPTKRGTTAQYRSTNMAYARVHVDHLPDPPAPVDAEVRRIMGISSWDERVVATLPDSLRDLAETYCLNCRQFAKDQAGEAEWRGEIHLNVARPIVQVERWRNTLRYASDKPWNRDLKPNRQTYDTPQHWQTPMSDAAYGAPLLPHTPSTPSINSGSTDLEPASSVSDTTSISETASNDPFGLLTPKPDVTIGLSHNAFGPQHQTLLISLQNLRDSTLTDPHASEIGLRFPFLLVEAKGNSANGNLAAAHNQAAVSGACALNILQDVDTLANLSNTHLESDPSKASPPHICFSIATEGPQHELWVHFRSDEGAYHMSFLRSWRTTVQREAEELIHVLVKIVQWGVCCFKEGVERKLDRVLGLE